MKERCEVSTLKKTLILGTSSALALSGMASGFAVAATADNDAAQTPIAADAAKSTFFKTDIVTMEIVPGEFAYTQNEVSSNAAVAAVASAAK